MSSANFVSLMLASGGDQRISVPRGGNTNIYGASPFPRSTLGYSSSTANDISLDAFHHLDDMVAGRSAASLSDASAYAEALEAMRARLKHMLALPQGTEIAFAPSGTDLEFVALAIASARSARPVVNILLGMEEVGSGCGLAAGGRYFANQTALCAKTTKGAPVDGFGETEIRNVPVRHANGKPLLTAEAVAEIDAIARDPACRRSHILLHVVHGSKTGLVLPDIAGIDALIARHPDNLSLVVDACQARLEADAIHAYLARGAIVLLTGSKFMGGPPFSGIALIPAGLRPETALAPGLATIFRRGEWPVDWACCAHLPNGSNPGLWLRLEAALFELERFQRITLASRKHVITHFMAAVSDLADRLGVSLVSPALASDALHLSTLATLDLSSLPGAPNFAVAQRWHRVLAARGLRLGQPVKCVRGHDGDWAGTMRLSLSMPLIFSLSDLDGTVLAERFRRDFGQIAQVLEAAQRPIVA
ncbi:MAG: hypothetical protein WCY92_13270 [Novosphingobium sp.]